MSKLKSAGYEVYGIHPELETLHGCISYKKLSELPIVPDALFMIRNPDLSLQLTREEILLKVPNIWMHNLSGIKTNSRVPQNSSIPLIAVEEAEKAGLTVIAGSKPMQYLYPVNVFHRCIRWFNETTGKV